MLIFEQKGTWKGKGVLSDRFCGAAALPELLHVLIKETKEAGRIYENLVNSDGRLIGQERHDLAEELEDLLGGYLYLYRYLLDAGDKPFQAEFCESGLGFAAQFDGYAWRAQGVLRKKALSGSFADWFNTGLLAKTSSLVKQFGAALADGVVNPEEKEAVCRELNEAVYLVLCADKGLKSGELS